MPEAARTLDISYFEPDTNQPKQPRSLRGFDWETAEDRQRQAIAEVINNIPEQFHFSKTNPEFHKSIAKVMVHGWESLEDEERARMKLAVGQGIVPQDIGYLAWKKAFRNQAELTQFESQKWQALEDANDLWDEINPDFESKAVKFAKKVAGGESIPMAGAMEVVDDIIELIGFSPDKMTRRPEDFINPMNPEDRNKFSAASTADKFRYIIGTLGGYADAALRTVVETPKMLEEIPFGDQPEGQEDWKQTSVRVAKNTMKLVQPVADWSTMLGMNMAAPVGSDEYYAAFGRFYDNPVIYLSIFSGGLAKAKGMYAKAKGAAVAEFQAAKAKAGEAKTAETQKPTAEPKLETKTAAEIEGIEKPQIKTEPPVNPVEKPQSTGDMPVKPAETPKTPIIPAAAETGNPLIDMPSKLAHQQSRVGVAEHALNRAKEIGDERLVETYTKDLKTENVNLAKIQKEFDLIKAEATDNALISQMGRPELIKNITTYERSAYEVLKAVDNARNKYLKGTDIQNATTGDLAIYYKRIKARMRKAGVDESSVKLAEPPVIEIGTIDGAIKSAEAANNYLGEIAKLTGVAKYYNKLRPRTPAFLEWAKQTKSRFNTLNGKQFVNDFIKADADKHVLEGSWLEQAYQAGIGELKAWQSLHSERGWNWRTGEEVAALMEGQKHPAMKQLMDAIHKTLTDAGVEMKYIGEDGVGYFPRMLKREIADILIDDINALEKVKAAAKSGSDKAVADALKSRSTYMQQIMDHLLKTDQVKSVAGGLRQLKWRVLGELFNEYGFEKTRQIDLPAELYERNAHEVIPRYIHQAAQRAAEARMWGPKGERYFDMWKKLNELSPDEAVVATKSMELWTGLTERTENIPRAGRALVDGYTGFAFVSKIATGRAPLLQTTQVAISIIPDMGVFKTFRGAISLFDRSNRSFARQSGIMTNNMILAMTGYMPGGIWGKFTKMSSGMSGFTGLNKGLNYLAAATARVALKDWYRMAQRDGVRGRWARKRLSDFDIDWKMGEAEALSEANQLQAMYRFANESQLQKNIMKEPLFANHPKARPFVLFKRFGMRQAVYMKEMVTRELKQGNVAPVLRLAAAGYLGGEFVHWALSKILTELRGEPVYRKEDSMWERAAENFGVIGAMGVMTDVLAIEKLSKLGKSAKFIVGPVGWSDFEKSMEAYTRFMEDHERYGDYWLATKRNAYRLADVWGTYPKAAAQRLKTKPQRAKELSDDMGVERALILDLILEGNNEAASRRMYLWDKHHPNEDDKFSYSDFTTGDLLDRAKAAIHRTLEASEITDFDERQKLIDDAIDKVYNLGQTPEPGDYEKTGATDPHVRKMQQLIEQLRKHFDDKTSLDRGGK